MEGFYDQVCVIVGSPSLPEDILGCRLSAHKAGTHGQIFEIFKWDLHWCLLLAEEICSCLLLFQQSFSHKGKRAISAQKQCSSCLITTSPWEGKGKSKKGNCISFSVTYSQDRLVPIPDVGHACFSTTFSLFSVYLNPASKSLYPSWDKGGWSFPSHF